MKETALEYAIRAVREAQKVLRDQADQLAVEPPRSERVVFEGPKPAATVIMFCYDERPCLNLFRSLLRDAREWPLLFVGDTSKDALIDRARSTVATHYLEQGAGDVLVMLDHDIGWEEGDLEHLVRACYATKGVVAGMYPKRGFGHGVPVRLDGGTVLEVGTDVIVEANIVSTGFMAIHREVLDALVATGEFPMTRHGYRPFFLPDLVDHGGDDIEEYSEDWAFCRRVQEAGHHVFVDCRPRLSHFGTHLYTMPDSQRVVPPDDGSPVLLRFIDGREAHECQGFEGPLRLYLDPDDNVISRALRDGQEWESEVLQALEEASWPHGARLLEIGAHLGYVTAQAAWWYDKVVAVEPLPHLAQLLRKNTAAASNVTVVQAAVVDEPGEVRIQRDLGNPGASHLARHLGIRVRGMTLREIVEEELGGVPPDVIKLDAEGAEWLILKDHAELLRHVRTIVFEYCDAQYRDISGIDGPAFVRWLNEQGYEVRSASEHELVTDAEAQLPGGRAYVNLVATRVS